MLKIGHKIHKQYTSINDADICIDEDIIFITKKLLEEFANNNEELFKKFLLEKIEKKKNK